MRQELRNRAPGKWLNRVKKTGWALLALLALYLILLIPDGASEPPRPAGKKPFIWNQDAYWTSLQQSFLAMRELPPDSLEYLITLESRSIDSLIDLVGESAPLRPDDPVWPTIETAMFEHGPKVAARTGWMPHYIESFTALRNAVKKHSRSWDMSTIPARDRIYRLLYGGRAGVEEIMLQAVNEAPALIKCSDEPSQTPAAMMLGVTIRSGDILVSRGGAPTSALIARGNDYPGNFSHVALVHVDDKTNAISIIESHIECGVTISPLGKYLEDTKLRVMVLRLRSDLPALEADPMLPHKAATLALQRAEKEHIPYDFEMDFSEPGKLFCSEVASAPYGSLGVTLWMKLSSISGEGVTSWLSAFGITHFETQEPADLEYDPQLTVVAEWRDPETLYKDHIDNAVIDALLERADKGLRLEYDRLILPFARVTKAYSWVLNLFGGVGPVPEGMNATAALRNKWFSRLHTGVKSEVLIRAAEFERETGYRPPYWELVRFAREAADKFP